MGIVRRAMTSMLVVFSWHDHGQSTPHYNTDTPTGCPLLMPAENRQRRHILNKPLGLNIPHVNGVTSSFSQSRRRFVYGISGS